MGYSEFTIDKIWDGCEFFCRDKYQSTFVLMACTQQVVEGSLEQQLKCTLKGMMWTNGETFWNMKTRLY